MDSAIVIEPTLLILTVISYVLAVFSRDFYFAVAIPLILHIIFVASIEFLFNSSTSIDPLTSIILYLIGIIIWAAVGVLVANVFRIKSVLTRFKQNSYDDDEDLIIKNKEVILLCTWFIILILIYIPYQTIENFAIGGSVTVVLVFILVFVFYFMFLMTDLPVVQGKIGKKPMNMGIITSAVMGVIFIYTLIYAIIQGIEGTSTFLSENIYAWTSYIVGIIILVIAVIFYFIVADYFRANYGEEIIFEKQISPITNKKDVREQKALNVRKRHDNT